MEVAASAGEVGGAGLSLGPGDDVVAVGVFRAAVAAGEAASASVPNVERAALEGSSIAYVVRASEAGAVSAGDAQKALRALTVALGFFETARDAAKVALERALG